MQETQPSFLACRADRTPETLSKKGFAELVGVSPGRVSQLIKSGLPVEPNNRIHVERGKAWMRENIDANRRRADLSGEERATFPSGNTLSPRGARDVAEAEISRLKAERLSGRMIDRKTALRVIEGRAIFERDALIGWVNRVAPALASETGGELATIIAVLDREVRAHLVSLAEKPLELPK